MNGTTEENVHRMLWKPKCISDTNMDEFRRRINEKKDQNFHDYYSLYKWSVDHHDEFWEEFWHYAEIKCSQQYDQVLDTTVPMDEIPEWFPGARLNYAENVLCRGRDQDVAIYFTSEGRGDIVEVTFRELKHQVSIYARALRSAGILPGDRVVGYIANCPEAIYAMLAAASIGAVWSSTSPDFGVSGVLDRFRQIQPKIIFSVNGVIYNNKHHLHLEKLDQVVKGLPDLKKVIVIPFIESNVDIAHIPNRVSHPSISFHLAGPQGFHGVPLELLAYLRRSLQSYNNVREASRYKLKKSLWVVEYE